MITVARREQLYRLVRAPGRRPGHALAHVLLLFTNINKTCCKSIFVLASTSNIALCIWTCSYTMQPCRRVVERVASCTSVAHPKRKPWTARGETRVVNRPSESLWRRTRWRNAGDDKRDAYQSIDVKLVAK